MTVVGEVYRCVVCSNVVEVLEEGKGRLFCCGEPMEEIVGYKNKV